MRRALGGFWQEIAFQSSQHNQGGAYVALWVHVHVYCPALQRWRKANPCLRPGTGFLAGGQIGGLTDAPQWCEWNLAQPSFRLAEVVDLIRLRGLAYFFSFNNIESLQGKLCTEKIPALQPASALDFAMCFGGVQAAQAAARCFYDELPGAREGYLPALQRLQREGLPSTLATNHAEVLAHATLLFGLTALSAG